MAIKVIAQRREVKLGKNPGMKFVMRPDLYIPIQEKKVFAEASTHSGISAGVIKAAWDAAGEVLRTWALTPRIMFLKDSLQQQKMELRFLFLLFTEKICGETALIVCI